MSVINDTFTRFIASPPSQAPTIIQPEESGNETGRRSPCASLGWDIIKH